MNFKEQTNEYLFFDGDKFFESLIEDIGNSKLSIEVETYIFTWDFLTQRIILAMKDATQRGVQAKLLVDGVGALNLSTEILESIKKAKIEIQIYHPVPWNFSHWRWSRLLAFHDSLSSPPNNFQPVLDLVQKTIGNFVNLMLKINQRNHRKLCVLDQKIAYLGSMNFTKVHLSIPSGGNGWRDTGLRLEGPDVQDLQDSFQTLWTGGKLKSAKIAARNPRFRINISYLQRRRLYKNLLTLIYGAKQRIWVTNAYFIPEERLLRRLRRSARAGCDVRLLLPKESDVPPVKWSSLCFYVELLKSGIKIYEYEAGVLHAKVLMVDDQFLIGSSNLNTRSLWHDYELDAFLTTENAKAQQETQFQVDLKNSKEITVANWHKVPLWQRLLGRALLLFRVWM